MTLNEDEIWNDFYSCIEICDNEEEVCKHNNVILDFYTREKICTDCAMVIQGSFENTEWNTYKDDMGCFKDSSQRADTWISDNPYDNGGSIPGFKKHNNRLFWRLHYAQALNHKQKTFWNISQKFEEYCNSLAIPSLVIPVAKDMWHIYMESGKLTRASVRNGLIGSCLYYACVHSKVPVDRKIIIVEITLVRSRSGSGNKSHNSCFRKF